MLTTLKQVISVGLSQLRYNTFKPKRIAVVGVTGRCSSDPLTRESYQEMLSVPERFNDKYPIQTLITGGNGFVDHAALTWAFKNKIQTHVHVPSAFHSINHGFLNDEGGFYLNRSHKIFKDKTGINSLKHLDGIIKTKKIKMLITPGIFLRDAMIASECDVLIAVTFGTTNIPKKEVKYMICKTLQLKKLVMHYSLTRQRWGVVLDNGRISEL